MYNEEKSFDFAKIYFVNGLLDLLKSGCIVRIHNTHNFEVL